MHLLLSWLAYCIWRGGVVFSQEMLPRVGDVDNNGVAHNKPKRLFSNPSVYYDTSYFNGVDLYVRNIRVRFMQPNLGL